MLVYMACVNLADVLCPSLPPLKAGGVFCLLRAGVLVFRVDVARGGWVKEEQIALVFSSLLSR